MDKELIIKPQKVLGDKYYFQNKFFDELNVKESETHGLSFPTFIGPREALLR